MHYDTKGKAIVATPDQLRQVLIETGHQFYVYLLCHPPLARKVKPFYVGIGKNLRVFSHEHDAQHTDTQNPRLNTIRAIWNDSGHVVRVIDTTSEIEPWDREEELINEFGLIKDGTGILVNEQRYSPSNKVGGGIELRKYHSSGNSLPDNFIRENTRLAAGPRKPRSPASVYGKIYNVLLSNPGVTGSELVELLLKVDFSQNKSAYTLTGAVSRPWLAGYIDGGFYKKNQCIQEYKEKNT